jgi:chromosome segregation ATPase
MKNEQQNNIISNENFEIKELHRMLVDTEIKYDNSLKDNNEKLDLIFKEIGGLKETINQQSKRIEKLETKNKKLKEKLDKQGDEIQHQNYKIEELEEDKKKLENANKKKDQVIEEQKNTIEEQKNTIEEKNKTIQEQKNTIENTQHQLNVFLENNSNKKNAKEIRLSTQNTGPSTTSMVFEGIGIAASTAIGVFAAVASFTYIFGEKVVETVEPIVPIVKDVVELSK